MEISLILLAAGDSTRFKKNMDVKKQWLRVGHKPLFLYTLENLRSSYKFKEVIIVVNQDEKRLVSKYIDDNSIKIVAGGFTRKGSLENALKEVNADYVLVSDAARALANKDIVNRLIDSLNGYDCVVPYMSVHDTSIYKDSEVLDREDIKLIQTPQLSNANILREILEDEEFTDESSAMLKANKKVSFIRGANYLNKITTFEDLSIISHLPDSSDDTFVGHGVDIHPFEKGKPMVLCGVKIDSEFGFKAHSDGDVAIHALIDAILGAIGGFDIGEWFSDTQSEYKGISSVELLKKVITFSKEIGYNIANIDLSIVAETPKLQSYKSSFEKSLAKAIKLERRFINIKATTSEKLGFVGNKEGVKVYATVSMKYLKRGINEDIDT